ncbi:MAG: CPBP family intramembrane metalloprotease [Clostridia bacterium]|nr:CPBP family intramembrane metalloprotease [Clostridia bacterium]
MSYDYYSSFFGGSKNEKPPYDSEDKELDGIIVKNAKRTHSRLFGALAIYLILASVLNIGLVFGLYYLFPEAYGFVFRTTLGSYLSNAVILYLICLPVFYLMIRKMEKRDLPKRRIGAVEFIGILAISQVLMLIGNYVGIFFNALIGSVIGRTATNTTVEMIQSSSIPLMLIFSVVLAPIFEELLMRKLLIDRLSKFGSGFALIVSSVAFGLFHGNFYQFFYATLLGFVLGYLYIRGGLKYSVLLHMILNFMGSVLATLYNRAGAEILSATSQAEISPFSPLIVMLYSFLTYGLLLWGAVLLFVKFRRGELRFSALDDARMRIPKGSVGKSVFLNVGMIVFIIVCAATMLESLFL